MKSIDTLLHARWVIPVTDGDPVLDQHSIAIHDGRIIDILPTEQAKSQYQAHVENDYNKHALIPGLINSHTHAAMNLFRGMADDLPLMDWLNNHIWPAEQRWVTEEFIQDGSELAMAEMLRSGTTCFNDMYFFPDITARVATSVGMRACVGLIVIDFPTIWAQQADEYIEKGLDLRDKYRSSSLIHTPFAPHAPFTVSDEPLQKIRMLADEMDLPVHIHVHETAHEVEEAVKNTGKRPLQRLHELGLVSPNLVAVHMTQLTDDEITLLAKSGSHIAHCPESNLKLASGFCPTQRLLDAGINVALGTDSSASNNDLDMLGEMRTAALLGKGVAQDATAVSAEQALRMATINGARALGLDQSIGSLETGKYADIVAIDFETLESAPVYHPVSHLVYSCNRNQVTDVWVAGKHLLTARALTTLDEQKILRKTRQWNDKISSQ
ncbi:MAG: TRZ/ATZ family hydrolase [Gammaproteobacteria bacterium]|nr:TRZ/ATZ family hydrolase [Gammaproteobacteria bacterium]